MYSHRHREGEREGKRDTLRCICLHLKLANHTQLFVCLPTANSNEIHIPTKPHWRERGKNGTERRAMKQKHESFARICWLCLETIETIWNIWNVHEIRFILIASVLCKCFHRRASWVYPFLAGVCKCCQNENKQNQSKRFIVISSMISFAAKWTRGGFVYNKQCLLNSWAESIWLRWLFSKRKLNVFQRLSLNYVRLFPPFASSLPRYQVSVSSQRFLRNSQICHFARHENRQSVQAYMNWLFEISHFFF